MRLTISRIAILFILLLWIVVCPLVVLRSLVQVPNLYTRWIQNSSVYEKLDQVITILIFRSIPEENWSPWISRHPDVIHNMINLVVDKQAFQRSTPQYMVCWVEWWIGEREQPCRIAPELADAVTPAEWEIIRAFLWETLPTCTQSSSSGCKPANLADYAEYGQHQSKWWAAYRIELVEMLIDLEEQAVSPLPSMRVQKQVYTWLVLLVLVVTLILYVVVESKIRVTYLSLLLLSMGGGLSAVGLCLALSLVRYPTLGQLAGLHSSVLFDLLLPQIWPMLAYILGTTHLMLGCLLLIPAVIGLSVTVQQHTLRYAGVGIVIILFTSAYLLYPETVFPQTVTMTEHKPQLTPTPWPTFTPTATMTPAPTPRSWPVSQATPLPFSSDNWWQEPQILRCTTNAQKPYRIIRKHEDELWLIQADRFYRFDFAKSVPLAEIDIPHAYHHITLAPSGKYAALATGKDVWFYMIPGWEPVLRSRITTLAPVSQILFGQDENHVIMGLENGYIWISDIQTGELISLFSAHQHPVTALANHQEPGLFYSGAADGTISVWEHSTGNLLEQYTGHNAEIHSIHPINTGTGIVTLDMTGRFISWDAVNGTIIRERIVASIPSANLTFFASHSRESSSQDDAGVEWIIGGTNYGQVFLLDREFDYQILLQFDSPLSFVYPVESDYLIVGDAEGKLCVVGTP